MSAPLPPGVADRLARLRQRTNAQTVVDGRKLCSHCRRRLPLDDFTRHPHSSTGLNSRCRDCVREGVRQHRARRRAS